jgi:hypothetical protein
MVFLERQGIDLHRYSFVHVREVEGPDRGLSKVYRVLQIRESDRLILGEYWEQPSLDGSSLVPHDFEAGDHDHFKELPEIVLTPETWLLPFKLIQSKPVFAFHWTAIAEVQATPIGISGAYVFGRRIRKSSKGNWSSSAIPAGKFSPLWEQSPQLQKLGRLTHTQHVWGTYRLLGDTIHTVLNRGSPEEWSDSEMIRGFDVVRWNLICALHPGECTHNACRHV